MYRGQLGTIGLSVGSTSGLSSKIWSPLVAENCGNFSCTIDLFSYILFYNFARRDTSTIITNNFCSSNELFKSKKIKLF